MAKVVSVLSAGHSGSTLCDILMGTIPGVFSTGECIYFPWQLHRDGNVCEKKQDLCSCGNKFSECDTWKKIVDIINGEVGYDLFSDPFSFEMVMLRSPIYGRPPGILKKIKRVLLLLEMERLSVPGIAHHFIIGQLSQQLNNNWLFYDSIGKSAGVSHIVDSSKDILRAKLLYQQRPGDVFAVILMRDILGVAASCQKRGKDPFEEAEKWVTLYRQFLRILSKTKHMRVKVIHYEQLAEKPETVREELAQFLGLPLPQSPLKINTREFHLIAGNPMRYKGNIKIRYDDSWKEVLSPDMHEKVEGLREKYRSLVFKFEELGRSREVVKN